VTVDGVARRADRHRPEQEHPEQHAERHARALHGLRKVDVALLVAPLLHDAANLSAFGLRRDAACATLPHGIA